jgi:hypothetical protein
VDRERFYNVQTHNLKIHVLVLCGIRSVWV